ncbi:MAG: hypothetical protein R3E01_26320 [Pirellulaceae bacterium]|nr:hypothetical protein [Planctomycetales bacterium]
MKTLQQYVESRRTYYRPRWDSVTALCVAAWAGADLTFGYWIVVFDFAEFLWSHSLYSLLAAIGVAGGLCSAGTFLLFAAHHMAIGNWKVFCVVFFEGIALQYCVRYTANVPIEIVQFVMGRVLP